MFSPIACMLCAVDPAATSLLLPLAQATLISAPILLRGCIRRGVRAARGRWQGPTVVRVVDAPSERAEGAADRSER